MGGDSFEKGKLSNQLEDVLRTRPDELSWFDDVIIREGSFWFSLLPDNDFKKKLLRFHPQQDKTELICIDTLWDPITFHFLGLKGDQYIFLKIDEEYLGSIVFAEFY